jgi:hypothetical protein
MRTTALATTAHRATMRRFQSCIRTSRSEYEYVRKLPPDVPGDRDGQPEPVLLASGP